MIAERLLRATSFFSFFAPTGNSMISIAWMLIFILMAIVMVVIMMMHRQFHDKNCMLSLRTKSQKYKTTMTPQY